MKADYFSTRAKLQNQKKSCLLWFYFIPLKLWNEFMYKILVINIKFEDWRRCLKYSLLHIIISYNFENSVTRNVLLNMATAIIYPLSLMWFYRTKRCIWDVKKSFVILCRKDIYTCIYIVIYIYIFVYFHIQIDIIINISSRPDFYDFCLFEASLWSFSSCFFFLTPFNAV